MWLCLSVCERERECVLIISWFSVNEAILTLNPLERIKSLTVHPAQPSIS